MTDKQGRPDPQQPDVEKADAERPETDLAQAGVEQPETSAEQPETDVAEVDSERSETDVDAVDAERPETEAGRSDDQTEPIEIEPERPEAADVVDEAPEPSEEEAEDGEPAASVTTVEDVEDVSGDTFAWHPEYAGMTADQVQMDLAQQIASDQRQHRLAMDGAEEAEHDALASVVGLERKWGVYDFDWAEQDPEELASRIVEFEQEREDRQEMISWSEYRAEGYLQDGAADTSDRPAPELSTGIKAMSLLLVVLLIIVILLAVWAL